MSRLRAAARSDATAAFSASASDCSARSASATFWNAVITVLWYCAAAWSNAACAARCLCSNVPKSKTGAVRPPAIVQKFVPGVNMLAAVLALLPRLAVSVICGSRAATATPICALALCMFASAARTSGRCSTSLPGRLTGRSSGSCNPARSKCSRDLLARETARQCGQQVALLRQLLLQRRQRLLGLRQRRLLRGDVAAGYLAQVELAAQDDQQVGLFPDDLLVAAIWPRNEASCTAAATTLEVSVR